MNEDAWWYEQEQNEQWQKECIDANERELERTGSSVSQGTRGDHRGAQGLGEPFFQEQVQRFSFVLGCLQGASLEARPLGDSVPDDPTSNPFGWDRSHVDLSGDDLAAFLGAVDAF
jgi:hypothetical protein